jgi:carbonic anhydrase
VGGRDVHRPREDVRRSIARIKAGPFIPRKVRGFVYDVHTGDLREVKAND